MASTSYAMQARERRFAVSDSHLVTATIQRQAECVPASVAAEVFDFSPGGAKLQVGFPLAQQERVELHLQSEALELDLRMAGVINWIRPVRLDTWLLGCQITPKIPNAALERLFHSGILDRRQFARLALKKRVQAQWELSGEPFPLEVIDLSVAGFSAVSPLAGRAGQRLLVITHGPGQPHRHVVARMQWCAQLADKFLLGCSFAEPTGFAALRQTVDGKA